MPDSPDTSGRKSYPERKSCGFQKYPYTCGRPKSKRQRIKWHEFSKKKNRKEESMWGVLTAENHSNLFHDQL